MLNKVVKIKSFVSWDTTKYKTFLIRFFPFWCDHYKKAMQCICLVPVFIFCLVKSQLRIVFKMKPNYILVFLTCAFGFVHIVKSGGGDHCKNSFCYVLLTDFSKFVAFPERLNTFFTVKQFEYDQHGGVRAMPRLSDVYMPWWLSCSARVHNKKLSFKKEMN